MNRDELERILRGGHGRTAEEMRNTALFCAVCLVGLVLLTVVCLVLGPVAVEARP